ncbi:cyclic nucleotide-binding domain-containing protein [Methylocystis parvus]|uniref:Cyclic nucleotide-binding domain-containing protein n=1 Tax=Methylocystis parvus TaxID=134 RepID=A0A6B8M1N4_9HYPH|nr:cyclic nucleotide-binding domain-containing protein [Methylocystis parvus]QGM96205.1 cyclic nucleotide-binding domain-containing protein [Methylocystis parvus]WBJ99968.1 cyclic nucleotide-binding domain-containing protein [Methylocystis parvus OBBP]
MSDLIDAATTWVASETGKTAGALALGALAWAEASAVVGAAYFKRMIPLRITAMVGNILGVALGLVTGNLPTIAKHAINFPLNFSRLREMRRLIDSVREANANDLNIEWLKPFMHPESLRATDYVFKKGDAGEEAYVVVEGEIEIVERGVTIGPGALFGEMALFTKSGKRTATAKCVTDARLLAITYEQFEQLYFQNPEFGLYLVRLIVRRFEANHIQEEV